MRTPSNSPAASIARSPVTMMSAPAAERAFQDTVVRLVDEYGDGDLGVDDLPEIGQKDGDSGKLLPVACELSGENREELVHDRPGKGKRVLPSNDLAERMIGAPTGQR